MYSSILKCVEIKQIKFSTKFSAPSFSIYSLKPKQFPGVFILYLYFILIPSATECTQSQRCYADTNA
jgi:hypothetical protein